MEGGQPHLPSIPATPRQPGLVSRLPVVPRAWGGQPEPCHLQGTLPFQGMPGSHAWNFPAWPAPGRSCLLSQDAEELSQGDLGTERRGLAARNVPEAPRAGQSLVLNQLAGLSPRRAKGLKVTGPGGNSHIRSGRRWKGPARAARDNWKVQR